MRKLRTEQEIKANWRHYSDEPLVSICCITYNHEPYIEDAIEGFLIQETDFPFEIIIHDDASTDRTADIIRKYEKAFPSLIKPIYQSENQYSKGNRATMIVYPKCRGKYIAVCEGDDYWCDPAKISKQVSFLEQNSEFVISSHDAFIVDNEGDIIKKSKLPDRYKKDYTGKDLRLGKAWLLTMNWMMRNVDIPEIPERKMVKNGDSFLVSVLGQYGGSHHHDDIKPSAYRVHDGGVWSSLSKKEKSDSQINTLFWMYRYYKRIGDKECESYYWKCFLFSVVDCVPIRLLISLILRTRIPESVKYSLRKIKIAVKRIN